MCRLGIMQPYFFPYIGYFSLIANTDRFVFFDTPQYRPRSWMNRNRIINETKEFTYITAAVKKAPQKTAIREIHLSEPNLWMDKLLRQLSVYRKRAPYYEDVLVLLKKIGNNAYDGLAQVNISSIAMICDYLEIPTKLSVFSEMELSIGEVRAADEWALEITKAMDFDTYINPPGGISFFHREKYAAAGIDLRFLQMDPISYIQRTGKFVPNLSIIDVMMFNPVERIREMLCEYTLI